MLLHCLHYFRKTLYKVSLQSAFILIFPSISSHIFSGRQHS
ncbi:unnamed protein product [Chondrus crispus]|uniref:Uncharacterized protein n=1 Tax=Chondrus crispus TaxID=2769 RepID=R7QJS6_CHOCR|nr:unnamed protein product [Chondrus crispus]CDF37973.1 unnamed protein product [Chondrus crispus]|eukprot:XP_005717842.1 unnamed protein product [Chondrus crispus]